MDLVEYENNYSKFYEIASHYIDLSIYILSKKFSYSQIKLIKAKNNLKLISKNFTLNFKIWNNPAANYSIRIQDGDIFYKLNLKHAYQGFEKERISSFDNLYKPKEFLKYSQNCNNEKFGFNEMYKDVFK